VTKTANLKKNSRSTIRIPSCASDGVVTSVVAVTVVSVVVSVEVPGIAVIQQNTVVLYV